MALHPSTRRSAMGCETWAISTSASKEAEARKFGATHFLVSTVRSGRHRNVAKH